MDIFTKVILGLLSLDTIRALIAMLGWVKPDAKLAWIIYGRYERNLIVTALKEMGFAQDKREKVFRSFKKISSDLPRMTGVTAKEAGIHLIVLLAKYIVKFPDEIRFGEGCGVSSNFYIDTMEIAHNENDLRKLCAIMAHLISGNKNIKKDVIISPKGGNPIFAQAFASSIQAKLLIAKADDDNSRIHGNNYDPIEFFKINYEGSWDVLSSTKNLRTIIVDCNTSDGAQLLNILEEVNRTFFNTTGPIKLKSQNSVFVLFCVNNQVVNIDEKFEQHNVNLVRFFDLDESSKNMLYELKLKCAREHRTPSYLNDEDRADAKQIIDTMKENQKYYYNP